MTIDERIEKLKVLQREHIRKGNKGTVNFLYGRIGELQEMKE